MIVYKTNLETIPANCRECPLEFCALPLCKSYYGHSDKLKKRYNYTRPYDCPLKEVKE